MSLRERLERKPDGYQFTIGRILAIYSGLMVTLLLAALDQTIVATALPKVVSDLGGITQYSWVFTAYMLGSTVTVPLYGKLGDVHGRRALAPVRRARRGAIAAGAESARTRHRRVRDSAIRSPRVGGWPSSPPWVGTSA